MRNLAFYRFLDLGQPPRLREIKTGLKAWCLEQGLKGTILLAPEGINGMLSGSAAAIAAARALLMRDFGLSETAFKETEVPAHSFNRMLVKVKKEVIPVGDPSVKPHEFTGQRLEAETLKRWLDEGRELVLLDTRNRYEIEIGTFKGAQDWGLDHFREFADRARAEAENLRGKTIVSFCTGGIRCEKASAVLLNLGLKDVYQLEGGILRYFEKNGSSHYQGNCFVFDQRDAVDGNLQPVQRSEDPKAQHGRHCLKS